MRKTLFILVLCFLVPEATMPQALDFTAVRAEVDFSDPLRDWDGFGFNYVETCQSRDYDEYPQDYGGFSILPEESKQEIIRLVFGEKGLKVGIVKIFLDPFHQESPGGPFNHERTTANMREFVRRGLKTSRERGGDLSIITTLYGPPAYTTRQKVFRGRDLDPAHKKDLAMYLIDWLKFLTEEKRFPVKYISLHNEGEDWSGWNREGLTTWKGHDYNMFWPPEQVAEFLRIMPPMLKAAGLAHIGLTNGEPSNWYRFSTWGISDVIAGDEIARNNLALITSHGFYGGSYGTWFGEHKSAGIDRLRQYRPELHAWVTSTSWSGMDARFIKEMHGNIYTAKVNAITPWAGIQRPPLWAGGDPNPGSAFTVFEDGSYKVRRGYYFYKQISRAGQPGMEVVRTWAMNSNIALIGFGSNQTGHPDALVVINITDKPMKVCINITGTEYRSFEAFRTTEDEQDLYAPAGIHKLDKGRLVYEAPAGSVSTFFARSGNQ